jgi:hypothetical protein
MSIPVSLFSENGRPSEDTLSGYLYAIGSQQQKILYQWHMARSTEDGLPLRVVYLTMDGLVAARDEVVWDRGEVRQYAYVRENLSEHARVVRRGDTLYYEQVLQGRVRRNTETYREDYTVGSALIPYLVQRWDALERGEKITARYGILDMVRSYQFEFEAVTKHQAARTDTMVVRMRPARPVLRLFADPVHIVFRREDREFQALIGRMLPVGGTGESPELVSAEMAVVPGSEPASPIPHITPLDRPPVASRLPTATVRE